jgi:hypothetical protein
MAELCQIMEKTLAFLPAITGWARTPPGPRATLHTSVTGRDGDRRRLSFSLSRELVDAAGWQGGERFVVSIGVGPDLGAFQISRCDRPRAGVKLIAHSRALGFRLHLNLPPIVHGVDVPELVDSLPRPCPFAFTIADGALVLVADVRRDLAVNGTVVSFDAARATS